ncbi:PREDICTED: uncharacterized protein LOC105969872 isoform X2 [Erythranthe guttata]|uniref:uncharacterized protein LOC105969872 isoform X2 n=1 Tax=Erythranthe guttata TaxID=4155 RepID=UPI00064DCB49|nr:PREDICTED: uncharacterized protein LOC105969872 isoform X2 [Erythranthe guttata]|eukprot:XP_012850101.1 PREDICTED: uncharacterized protein LOC105969872 isoform X2 [Erythranthe guttata]
MLELQNKKLDEGELIVDEENICGEVLGFKSGYIRRRGAGPKPKRFLPNQNYGKELEEAKINAKLAQVRAEEAAHKVMVLFDKLDKQQTLIQEFKEGLIATQKTMVEGQRSTTEMMSFFDQFRRMSQFPTMSPWFSAPPNQNQHNMQGFMHGIGSQKVQNSCKDSDAFSNERELRDLFREVGKYPVPTSF